MAERDTSITSLNRELEELEKQFLKIPDKKLQAEFYWHVRFVAVQLDAVQNNLINRNQTYQLAIHLEQLGNQIQGLPTKPELIEEARKLKDEIPKLVDAQLAKRYAQTYGADKTDKYTL